MVCESTVTFVKLIALKSNNELLKIHLENSRNTCRGQQQEGPEAVAVETGVAHAADLRGRGEVLGQTGQVQGPLPGIPLVHVVLGLEDFLVERKGSTFSSSVDRITVFILCSHVT